MHLPHDTQTLQLTAYVALTLSSIIVATTSLFIAYRQNFGWKPIIFPSSCGGGGAGKHGYTVSIDFEVWNRKKYPIAIRRVSVEYEKQVMHRYNEAALSQGWHIEGEHMLVFDQHETLDPGKSRQYALEAPIEKAPIDLHENVTVTLFYFDPIKNRIITLVVHTRNTLYLETMSKAERRAHRLKFWKRLPGCASCAHNGNYGDSARNSHWS
jgi:hypothetical protein